MLVLPVLVYGAETLTLTRNIMCAIQYKTYEMVNVGNYVET